VASSPPPLSGVAPGRRERVREAILAALLGVVVIFLMFIGRGQPFSWRHAAYGALVGFSIFVSCRLLHSLAAEPLIRWVGLPRPAKVWLGYLIPELVLPFIMAGAHHAGR
jgi:phosphate/sulfate permease